MKASYLVGGITLLTTMTLNFNHIADNYGLDGLNSLHQLIWAQSSSGGGSSSSGGGSSSSSGGGSSSGQDKAKSRIEETEDTEDGRDCLDGVHDDVKIFRVTYVTCKGIGQTSCTPSSSTANVHEKQPCIHK